MEEAAGYRILESQYDLSKVALFEGLFKDAVIGAASDEGEVRRFKSYYDTLYRVLEIELGKCTIILATLPSNPRIDSKIHRHPH